MFFKPMCSTEHKFENTTFFVTPKIFLKISHIRTDLEINIPSELPKQDLQKEGRSIKLSTTCFVVENSNKEGKSACPFRLSNPWSK